MFRLLKIKFYFNKLALKNIILKFNIFIKICFRNITKYLFVLLNVVIYNLTRI